MDPGCDCLSKSRLAGPEIPQKSSQRSNTQLNLTTGAPVVVLRSLVLTLGQPWPWTGVENCGGQQLIPCVGIAGVCRYRAVGIRVPS